MAHETHMVEIRPDISALVCFLENLGENRTSDENLAYGVHAWLSAAFGDLAPRPWRLLADRRRPTRILGYAAVDAGTLRRRLEEFAEPSVLNVCAPASERIASRVMPEWRPGRRLGFEVQCCPIGRKSRSGIEKDLFLLAVESQAGERASREDVYCEWGRRQIERDGAARVTHIEMSAFRLIKQARKSGGEGSRRSVSVLTRPHAVLRGELEVGDPSSFHRLVARGLGRHRAFGYEMLLLRPPS